MKLIVVEIVVGFGLPFAWGVWELVKLKREQRRDAEAAAAGLPAEPAEAAFDEARRNTSPRR